MNKQRLILLIPLAIFMLLGILFFKGLSGNPSDMPSALIDKPFPEFNLPLLPAEENPRNLIQASRKNIIGQVSLVNVWGTWCVTCRSEHEFLTKLKAEGVIIYGIYYPLDYNEEKLAAQKWLRELHNPYVFSILDEEGKLGMDLGVFGAPETFVLDKKGIIRHRHVGDVNEYVWQKDLKPILQALEKE